MKTEEWFLMRLKKECDNITNLCSDFNWRAIEYIEQIMYEKYCNYYNQFKEVYDPNPVKFKDMEYFQDKRTINEYNFDLLKGWMLEDFFKIIFKSKYIAGGGFNVKLNNHDSDRVIKKERSKITSDPDFICNQFQFEIQGMHFQHHKMNIKLNKYNKAIRKGSFLIHVNIMDGELIFLNPNEIQNIGELKPNENFGGKMCYEILMENIPESIKVRKENLIDGIISKFKGYA